jgi:hypothetical protein
MQARPIHVERRPGEFYLYGPDLVFVLGEGHLVKNDRHIFGCTLEQQVLALCWNPKPGTERLVENIDGYLYKYGALHYAM